MKKNIHIFTIMAGCAPVGNEMLKSFLKHCPDERINVYLFFDDIYYFDFVRESEHKDRIITHLLPESLKDCFARGHEGTAKVWARVMKANPDSYFIQIDSDIIFKENAIDLIKDAGYPDIYGSRRCYKNNPGKAPVHPGIEDAISTYFIGFNPEYLGSLLIDSVLYRDLERMIQGAYNPLGFPVLDFFDPVFFYARTQGAEVYYENPAFIGGQNDRGSKLNPYKSNVHLDMGFYLCHFGGAGSGYANEQLLLNNQKPLGEDSYVKWSLTRWHLFHDLLINTPECLDQFNDAVFDDAGRWVSGSYNKEIFNQIKADLSMRVWKIKTHPDQ